jgi:hypothetical protein
MNEPKPSQQKLSPALEKAVRDFNASSTMRMAKANEEDEPTQPLFHYTNQAALIGIIESETFWFTSIYHMDDTEELAFGFKVHQALLAEKIADGDAISKLFCEELVRDDELEKIKRVFEFYSVSFGTRDDARQWESYADKGRGVAFGLAPAFFKPLLKTAPAPEEMVFLGKVVDGLATTPIMYEVDCRNPRFPFVRLTMGNHKMVALHNKYGRVVILGPVGPDKNGHQKIMDVIASLFDTELTEQVFGTHPSWAKLTEAMLINESKEERWGFDDQRPCAVPSLCQCAS